MCGIMADMNLRRLRVGEEKKDRQKEETTGQKYNGLSYSIVRPYETGQKYNVRI